MERLTRDRAETCQEDALSVEDVAQCMAVRRAANDANYQSNLRQLHACNCNQDIATERPIHVISYVHSCSLIMHSSLLTHCHSTAIVVLAHVPTGAHVRQWVSAASKTERGARIDVATYNRLVGISNLAFFSDAIQCLCQRNVPRETLSTLKYISWLSATTLGDCATHDCPRLPRCSSRDGIERIPTVTPEIHSHQELRALRASWLQRGSTTSQMLRPALG